MKANSIYIRNINEWDEIPDDDKTGIEWIFCGDCGCPRVLPALSELICFRDRLSKENIGLHYISPKVNQACIEKEMKQVLVFLTEGIGVSINDWGLLYKIHSYIEPGHDVFIGRLLTKSIAEWVWSSIFLEKESQETVNYFMQNNFNHQIKIDFFKKWNIKGVDVNLYPECEESYAAIKKKGFEVIGFLDNPILSIARSCPLTRIDSLTKKYPDCRDICREDYDIIPQDDKQKKIYPKMKLKGNVIVCPKRFTPSWDGYYKLVCSWK